jgi:hypothetical protein
LLLDAMNVSKVLSMFLLYPGAERFDHPFTLVVVLPHQSQAAAYDMNLVN